MAQTKTTKANKTSATTTGRRTQGKENATPVAGKKTSAGSAGKAAKNGVLANKTNAVRKPTAVQTELEKLKAENAALKRRVQEQVTITPGNLIPRPIKKKGYSIRMIDALELADDREMYNAVRRYVRYSAMRAGIDMNACWLDQDKEKLAIVLASCRKRYGFLAKFSRCWPVEEILKIQLKNHRQYIRRLIKKMEETLGEGGEVVNVDVNNTLGHEQLGEEEEMVDEEEQEDEEGEDAEGGNGSEGGEEDAEMADEAEED